MDLVGPLPTAQGNCRFAVVAVDYFTKWVEAKPLANIKAPTIQKFLRQNIICRFGVPRELTVDNGKQFDCYTFKEYCKTLGTHAKFSSVYHPQSNGAVERENGLIFSGIKKCLFDQKKGKWVVLIPGNGTRKRGLLTVQNRAQVHRKPTSDLVPFHQGGSSLDLSIQGSETNS
jgi:transposase InsO family protein